MQIQAREIRHTVLLFLIVAIIPLIFYPSNLGLGFGISMALYLLLELVYFAVVLTMFLDVPPAKVTASASMICLGFRLCAGFCFGILLLMMNDVGLGVALGAGLQSYKPALLLQTLTAPFILMSLLRILFGIGKREKKGKLTITSISDVTEKEPPRPEPARRNTTRSTVIGLQTHPEPIEVTSMDFDSAVRHVYELSAVKFCVLFDLEGLPVAYAGDKLALRDIWAPVGRLVGDQIQTGLIRAGDLVLEGFDLTLDAYRLHAVFVSDMWLLVGADRQSEELEKVRIGQAVEMIKRIYVKKFVDTIPREVAEESHV